MQEVPLSGPVGRPLWIGLEEREMILETEGKGTVLQSSQQRGNKQ